MSDSLLSWMAAWPDPVKAMAGLAGLLLVGVGAHFAAKRYLIRAVQRAAAVSVQEWDDIVLEHNVLGRLAQSIPALIVYFGAPFVPGLGEDLLAIVRNVALAYTALMLTLSVSALLTAVNAVYERYPVARVRPIKGFLQVAKIVVYILGAVLVVSLLIAKSPVVLLTGFGAMTAIVLLVFRDTILSLVASVQLSSLDMIRVGDWIEMPHFDADGDVIDIALHTVKVQNWDKTITTIPTHKLISESFRNWRGMSESGGRRIKRSINIDVRSVRYLSDEEVERFRRFRLLADYIDAKRRELAEYNERIGASENVNLRRLTNIGTFRAYLRSYLEHHPRIRQDMTLLVRQVQPGTTGMPVEIYCFTNTTAWAEYEGIQADIFDHILAQCGEFGLEIFQSPSGADVAELGQALVSRPPGGPAGHSPTA